MRCVRVVLFHFACALVIAASAAGADMLPPARVDVPELKTSIYVGSVKLATSTFARTGEVYTAEYEAKVFPWFFWGETGRISITVSDATFERLAQGEQIEFTGEALNHKGKPRTVTGYARPADAQSGKLKVRIHVDDVELIFNGPYRLTAAIAAAP